MGIFRIRITLVIFTVILWWAVIHGARALWHVARALVAYAA